MDGQNIYSGLVICADCGKPLRLHRSRKIKLSQYSFMRATYKNEGKGACTGHYIRQSRIEAVILEDLRRTLWFAASKEREFAEIINRKNSAETSYEIKKAQPGAGKDAPQGERVGQYFQAPL